MNITLNKTDFLKALQVGGIFAGSNKFLPILDCVKIKVSGDKLIIVSTDKENAISKRMIGIIADGEGTFCVNAKDLMSYIKLIPSDTFELTINGNTAEVKHAKGSFTFPVENDDEFPSIKPDDNCVEVSINAALLNNWIADGKNFVASDTLRPIMEGLYIYCSNGELGCCSSDGHALFTDHINVDGVQDFNFVLNNNSFRPVCDAIANVDEVKIKIGEKNVVFIADGVSVISQLIVGKYVNFRSAIPKNNTIVVNVNRKGMINAISRCYAGANKNSLLIKLKVEDGKLEISSNDVDFNKSAIEYMDIESNDNIKIGLKYSTLMEILNAISSENVIITMREPHTAVIFKEDEQDSEKILLQMPMML